LFTSRYAGAPSATYPLSDGCWLLLLLPLVPLTLTLTLPLVLLTLMLTWFPRCCCFCCCRRCALRPVWGLGRGGDEAHLIREGATWLQGWLQRGPLPAVLETQ
jgi:hypothetical protein